jgi:FlaA1/EpsC-like NDP-sugar epimerase
MKELSNNIFSLPRNLKQVIVIMVDIGLCVLCTWLAFAIRLEEVILFNELHFYSALISIIIAIPTFWLSGLYRVIFRFTGLSIIFTTSISIFFYGLLYSLVILVYSIEGVPRTVGILQPMILFIAIISSRLAIKFIINNQYSLNKAINKQNVLVYGAGNAGRQLVNALENSMEFKVVGFIDDDRLIHKKFILGKHVYSPINLRKLVHTKGIELVFIAIPSISRSKKKQIIERLNQYKLSVKILPSVSEIVNGTITLSDIKDLNITDLLNREEVEPDSKLLNKNINSKIVLVTGAGGSIGSELCRQIIRLKPLKLILTEINEFALYKIYEELSSINNRLKIIPLLVNVQDQKKIEIIFETFRVNTVYHAAAYKHVPLVEENICEGVKNNVFSTLAVANASIIKKVSNLVFISSDKAVRPTNVMGATKRLSEICIQGVYNHTKNNISNFSIVRFGNVLESSGSVIPKFKRQIEEGGPVTLTHPDITRYFMTIKEAAQLVIQAGAMGQKCEVFVLDMGETVKIKDLIYNMIGLSGLTVKNNKNPNGDIEIKISGLRPGEKLYEELLIEDNVEKTYHEKIFKAQEPLIQFKQLKIDLEKLYTLLEGYKPAEVKDMLGKIVSSYQSNSKIIDHIYKEKLIFKSVVEKVPLTSGQD